MAPAKSPTHTQRCADKVQTAARFELRVYCHLYGPHPGELVAERQVVGVQTNQPEGWNGSIAGPSQ